MNQNFSIYDQGRGNPEQRLFASEPSIRIASPLRRLNCYQIPLQSVLLSRDFSIFDLEMT
jgi:hypothetical protein